MVVIRTIACTFITLVLFACSSNRPVFVQTNSSDVLYIGVSNPIVIKGRHLSGALLSIENGTFQELRDLSNDSTRFLEVTVSNTMPTVIKIDQDKRITTLKYRNKKIPDPVILISLDSSRIGSCSLSHEKFRTANGLVCNINGFDYNIAMKIISYKLTMIKKGKVLEPGTTNNNIVRNYASSADSSDLYIFHDVLMEFAETKEQRLLSGPTVFIK